MLSKTRNLLFEDSGENEEKEEIAEFAAQLTVSKPKETKENTNNIKSLLINEDNIDSNSEKDQLNKKLEESLLDKIKKN